MYSDFVNEKTTAFEPFIFLLNVTLYFYKLTELKIECISLNSIITVSVPGNGIEFNRNAQFFKWKKSMSELFDFLKII